MRLIVTSSCALVILSKLTDLVHLATFPFAKGSAWSLENEEGRHSCHLKGLLHLLHLVNISVDEHIIGLVVSRKLCEVILDLLARAAPRS